MENKKILFCIILMFCLLRIGLYWINPAYSWDELSYLGIAEGFHNGIPWGHVTDTFTDVLYRPSLLSFTIYLGYTLFGVSEIIAKLIVPIISIIAIIAVYFVGKEISNEKFGLIAAAILATNPAHLFFSYRVMIENYIGLLLVLDILFLLLAFKKHVYLLPLAFTLILTCITRYTNAAIIPAIFVALMIAKRDETIKMVKTKYFAASVLIFLAGAGMWLGMNQASYNNFPMPEGNIFLYLIQTSQHFGHYFLYWAILVAVLFPLTLYGAYKSRDNKNILMILIIIIVMLFGTDLFGWDMRYIVFTMPAFALLTAYGFEKINYRHAFAVLVLLLLINACIGYGMVMKFAYPAQQRDILTNIIEIDPIRERAYTEHISYKEAALALKEKSSENDKVVSNVCLAVWYYAKRPCWYIAANSFMNTIEKNLTNPEDIKNFVEKNDIKWMYMRYEEDKEFSGEMLTIQGIDKEIVYANDYVYVYKIK